MIGDWKFRTTDETSSEKKTSAWASYVCPRSPARYHERRGVVPTILIEGSISSRRDLTVFGNFHEAKIEERREILD